MSALLNETIATEPVLFIISPGVDPSQDLRELAAKAIGKEKYLEVRKNISIMHYLSPKRKVTLPLRDPSYCGFTLTQRLA